MTSEAKGMNERKPTRCRVVLTCILTLALASLGCLQKAALAESPEPSGSGASGTEHPAEGGVSALSKKDMGAVSEKEEGSVYESGEVCVLFDEDASPEEAEAELDEVGLSLGEEPGSPLEKGKAYAPSIVDGDSVAETLDEIRDNPSDAIAYAQPNYIYKSDGTADTGVDIPAGATNPDSTAATGSGLDASLESWQLDAVNAQEAWGITKTKGTVTVAVIDTGIDADHEDLKGRIVAGYNSVAGNNDYGDGNGHGTHVAGIVAATADNNIGVAGVSYNANLIAVDAAYSDENSGWYDTDDLFAAYQWLLNDGNDFIARYNLRVINMSLYGSRDGTSFTDGHDQLLFGQVDEAYGQGILTVCCAGNDNTDTLCFPGDYEKCMGVINLQQDPVDPDGLSRYPESNYGASKDIAAPGTDIYSTLNDGGYGYMTGTSMASPVVAGVAALVFATDPKLGADDVREILTGTARDLGEPGFDEDTAYGCVDACAAVTEALCHRKGHSYDTGVITKGQTCTEDGIRTHTCSVCGEAYEEKIPAPGHLWDNYDYSSIYESPVLALTYEAEYYNTSKVSNRLEYLYLYDGKTLVMSVNAAEGKICYINPSYVNYSVWGITADTGDYTYLYSGNKSGDVSVSGARFTMDVDETRLFDSYALVYNGSSYGKVFTTTDTATHYDTYVMHFANRLPITASVEFEYTGQDMTGDIDYMYLYDDKTLVMSVNVWQKHIYYMNPEYALTGVSGGISTGEATSETACLNCGAGYDG